MAAKDIGAQLRDILDKVEHSQARWALVAVGVIILLRLRLVLFAAALPIMAYWHYSTQAEEAEPQDGGDAADADQEPDDDLGPTMGDTSWPAHDDLDDDDLFQDNGAKRGSAFGLDGEDDAFNFGEDDAPGQPAPKRTAPAKKPEVDLDDVLRDDDGDDPLLGGGGGGMKEPPPKRKEASSWDAQIGADDDDFLGGPCMSSGLGGGVRDIDPLADNLRSGAGDDDPLAGLGSLGGLGGGLGGGGMDNEFDFLGGGLGDDMDFLGGMGGGKGKGKGKGKSKDKGGPMEPRGPNPKQVFVANIGDQPEDEIRSFFEEVGEVDRLKVLRTPDGASKGVCFVTFRTEDQAQKALGLHGTQYEGRNLVVRLAHGGKGEKGGEKGGGKGEGPLDLGGSERFGAAFGDREPREPREPRSGGKGGRGKGRKGGDRGEMDDLLEEALADGDGPLKPGDFDFAARRFLTELRQRDKADGTQRFQEALDMVLKYTSSKDRSSVRKWPAYVFTLLQKFDPNLQEEIRERDADRRAQKGGGPRGGGGDREARETPTSAA